jgi:predicted Holliday junction resolvase-like endonuclease
MTHYILRAWGYVGLLVLAVFVLIGLFQLNVIVGATVSVLGAVSFYISLFSKMTYDQKLRDEERALRDAQRDAERDRQWKEAQRRREQDQAEREKLAELEQAARQKRIQELSAENEQQEAG